MTPHPALRRLAATGAAAALLLTARGAEPSGATGPVTIDLPSALRLAGAQNLEVQLAAERAAEARANAAVARNQFFPWLNVGGSYAHHEGRILAVDGTPLDASKQGYLLDGAIGLQLTPGETYYRALAARQDREAARHAYEARRLETTLSAAVDYFELSLAAARIGIAEESLRVTRTYLAEVEAAVSAGIALPGDARRIEVESARRQMEVRRRREARRLAAARLATLLHLSPVTDLAPADATPPAVALVSAERALDSLVADALLHRPELKAGAAGEAAARALRNQAVYGPLAPSIGVQALGGGLGGGTGGAWNHFGATQDYSAGLGWRIGPGGLLDRPRQEAAEARWTSAKLRTEQIKEDVIAQVVNARIRQESQRDLADLAAQAVRAAEEALRLSRERKDFGVAGVLEFLQAEQALTGSRDELATAWAQLGEAEYGLAGAIGMLEPGGPAPVPLKKEGKER